jgi:hypothetical protein
MLGKSLTTIGMPELQKAVMGMDPAIKPFEALAELQTRVKREKMKQSMQAQNPQQPPVAQRMMSEAAALQNPYMSGLASAPVESPVGMAGGGIVAFQEGGDVPKFAGPQGSMVYAPYGFANTADNTQYTPEELLEAKRLREMGLGDLIGQKARAAYNWLTEPASHLQTKTSTRSKVNAETMGATLDAEDARGGEGVAQADKKAEDKTKKEVGLAGAAAARGAGGAGGSGRAGAAGVGLGSIPSAYETGFTPQTDDERIASMQKYKKAMGAQNEEFLAPIKERLAQYEKEAEDQKKYAIPDALVQAGLGMMAGKSQYALQNIGEGGAAGLAALRESKKADRAAQEKLLQAQSDMAKSRIALEKGDEQTAATLANQGRQEQQAAAQFNLLGQHYANQDAAAKLQAQAYMARANSAGGGGGDKHLAVLTRVRGLLNQEPLYKEAAKMANMPGPMGDKARQNMQEMEAKLYRQLAPELLAGMEPTTMQSGGPKLADADLALINKYMR